MNEQAQSLLRAFVRKRSASVAAEPEVSLLMLPNGFDFKEPLIRPVVPVTATGSLVNFNY